MANYCRNHATLAIAVTIVTPSAASASATMAKHHSGDRVRPGRTVADTHGSASKSTVPPIPSSTAPAVRRLPTVSGDEIDSLATLLVDCVEGGASVGFMQPMDVARAATFWRGVAAAVERGERALLVADDPGRGIVGTVQVVLVQPENQPHRADVAKMLVRRSARRAGVGAALLRAAEEVARDNGKSLLVLDTASADAERLYARHGWQRCGTVPGYALLPQGGRCDTTFFYRVVP